MRGLPRATALALVLIGFVLARLPAEQSVVELPPFIVEETSKGPPWRYAEGPNEEILSRCADSVTRDVYAAHWRLHQLLAEIVPPRLQLKTSVPKALILYDEALQPPASQEVIARMIHDTPPPPPDFGGIGRIGMNRPTEPRYTFLPNLRLWDRDAMSVFVIVRADAFNGDRLALTFNHVAYMVRGRVPALPLWFVSGILGLFERAEFDGGELALKPIDWLNAAHTAALKTDPKTAPGLRPLAEFFSSRLPVPEAGADFTPAARFKAEATVFVRWALDGQGAPRREGLWKFAERAAVGPTDESLFRECFGLDYAAADVQLAAYLPAAVRGTIRFRPKLPPPPALALRNASTAQLARLKGDWERLEISYVKAISPALAPKYLEQARRTLRNAYDHDERDPRLLAVLGLCEVDAGDEPHAREFLESAARTGPIRPRASFELARLRFAEFCAAGPEVRLTAGQTAEVLTPLFAARAGDPPLPEVYELIADVWAHSAAHPSRAHLVVLDEGIRLFPRDTTLLQRAAELYLARGFRDEAASLIEIGLRVSAEGPVRDHFVELQRQLSSAPAARD